MDERQLLGAEVGAGHGVAADGHLAVDGEVEYLQGDVGEGPLDVFEDRPELVPGDLEAVVAARIGEERQLRRQTAGGDRRMHGLHRLPTVAPLGVQGLAHGIGPFD